jgi:AbrB family looped-hinge helix DNA binding protein
MNTTLRIDKAGRVVLPKLVRDALQINPGDSLELESSDDQIALRPARGRARMYKKRRSLGSSRQLTPCRRDCRRDHPQGWSRA